MQKVLLFAYYGMQIVIKTSFIFFVSNHDFRDYVINHANLLIILIKVQNF